MLNPEYFELEKTSVWSFPDRGTWATHKGDYRGNWSPYVPRNLMLRYSKEREWVLDQFLGSGTTLIEAKLLKRNGIGTDVNPDALKIARERISFRTQSELEPRMEIRQASAANLEFIKNDSIHFICTHPPYANMIRYSDDLLDDLSQQNVKDFLMSLRTVAQEAYRVLRPGRTCAFMMGDLRSSGQLYPLGFKSMEVFQREGFLLKEVIIKEQHNCRSSEYWEGKDNNSFLLLAHEYIFVLQKPGQAGKFQEEAESLFNDPIDHLRDSEEVEQC